VLSEKGLDADLQVLGVAKMWIAKSRYVYQVTCRDLLSGRVYSGPDLRLAKTADSRKIHRRTANRSFCNM